jgi:hypothetical protein
MGVLNGAYKEDGAVRQWPEPITLSRQAVRFAPNFHLDT